MSERKEESPEGKECEKRVKRGKKGKCLIAEKVAFSLSSSSRLYTHSGEEAHQGSHLDSPVLIIAPYLGKLEFRMR